MKNPKGKQEIWYQLHNFNSKNLLCLLKVVISFASPIFIVQGNGRSRVKRYICLFTCLQIRAIHLEMAVSLEADALIFALKLFMARRAKPDIIISDNGKFFVGAANEIIKIIIDSYSLKIRTV